MNSRSIIEIDGIAAGVVIADRGMYRFCAALHEFLEMEGSIFPSPTHAARAVRAYMRGRRLRLAA